MAGESLSVLRRWLGGRCLRGRRGEAGARGEVAGGFRNCQMLAGFGLACIGLQHDVRQDGSRQKCCWPLLQWQKQKVPKALHRLLRRLATANGSR